MEVFSFIIGAVFGSFLNVLIYRLPLNKSIITPRSFCISCKQTISWYNNIPIFSYFILKAKCSNCDEKISISYPIVEGLSAFITLALYIKLGLSIEFFYALTLFYTLITLSFIDFEYKAVPDYLLLIAFITSFFLTSFSLFEALKNAFLISGAFVLLNFILTFYIQNIKAKFTKNESLRTQEALGEGDMPILAVLAVVLGIKGAIIAIFFSALFAIIPSIYFNMTKKDIQIPFIPYLSLGFTLEYFFNLSKVFI